MGRASASVYMYMYVQCMCVCNTNMIVHVANVLKKVNIREYYRKDWTTSDAKHLATNVQYNMGLQELIPGQ